MQIPIWDPSFLEPILAIGLLTLGFSIYHFVSISPKVKQRFTNKYGEVRGNTKAQWYFRYLGAMTIGIIPAILMMAILGKTPAEYGVAFKNHATSLYWILGLAAVIIPMNFFNSKKEKNLAFYPNVREKEWTKAMVAKNAFTWVSYLFGYELMFRGLLLFATVPLLGEWPAIVLNAALYALVHVPKNLEETIGAVPLGVLLCLITLTTGTIWVAFFVHITLALSNFFFSLRHHPDMKVI
ncbi:type II CAAX endopeptidase family protein [uncultured Roseivirga sp.]|uniref:CPBP family intramembrane glutamic endopeptidase n=1 Tax=uncultured Roseivirga sp. TaxID=543088 RepID=UPI0030D98266|tara:strand:- start:20952 stop:21668 length:717 start_codon:yes stop_codon:yes gene_type:complete